MPHILLHHQRITQLFHALILKTVCYVLIQKTTCQVDQTDESPKYNVHSSSHVTKVLESVSIPAHASRNAEQFKTIRNHNKRPPLRSNFVSHPENRKEQDACYGFCLSSMANVPPGNGRRKHITKNGCSSVLFFSNTNKPFCWVLCS